ncbi:hypothetical protein SAMN05216226_106102 [Halovenus aranensis]|uniref:Envelope protein N-terminal domain-containing protein n=2 Tax=Halovenus aranensis TaxID=890420 RepID=A0A1G8VAA9_9EURY|nr:hypothetical protein SAMN05216226_106102 [Halovenus aranensis]
MMKGTGWTLTACAVGATATGSGAAADSTPTPTDGDGGSDGFGDGFFGAIGKASTSPMVFNPAHAVASWLSGDSDKAEKEALQRSAYHDAKRYRKSMERNLKYQESTLDYVFDGLFADAKARAIQEINKQKTKDEVEQAALSRALAEVIKLQQNVILANNGAVETIRNYWETAEERDIDKAAVMDSEYYKNGDYAREYFRPNASTSYQLLDGSDMDVQEVELKVSEKPLNKTHQLSNVSILGNGHSPWYFKHPDGKTIEILPGSVSGQLSTIEDRWTDSLKPDIQTWVANAYDEVASGNIETGDLVTSIDLAQQISDEEPANRAIADLRMSGIPVKTDHKATISTALDAGHDATVTVYDVLLASSGTSASVAQGDTVDPSNVDYDWLINYKPSNVEISWPHYQSQIDGGVATINRTPSVEVAAWLSNQMTMQITTSYDETVALDPAEVGNPKNSGQSFDVDLSEQLDQQIAEIQSIKLFSAMEENAAQTKFMKSSFTVEEIGGDVSELNFEHDRSVQTTDNYMTEEEWKQRREDLKKTQEAISTNNGAINIGLPDFSFPSLGPNIPTLPGMGVVESVIVGGAAVFTLDFLRK